MDTNVNYFCIYSRQELYLLGLEFWNIGNFTVDKKYLISGIAVVLRVNFALELILFEGLTTDFLWVCTNWCGDFPSITGITHLLAIIFNLSCSQERQLYHILGNLKSCGIFDDHLTTMFSSFDFGMLKLFISLIFSKIPIVIYTLNPKLLTL